MAAEDQRTDNFEPHYPPPISAGGRESNAHVGILDSVSDAIITTDMDFVILSWNRAAETIYGWRADEVMGKPLDAVIPTTYGDTTRESVLTQLVEHGKWKGDIVQRCKDELTIYVMSSLSLLTDTDEHPIGTISINRDITERKRTIDDLRKLKEFHETLVQGLAEGIVVTNEAGHIEHVNPAGAALLGYPAEELVGRRWLELIPVDQQVAFHAARARRKQGGIEQYELTLVHPDGSPLNLLVSGNSRFDEEQFMGSIITFTDITGLVRTQQAVLESRRFLQSTLNALSAHIAILDDTGTIIEVNAAWRRFADENDLNDPTYGVGTNYLALCDTSSGSISDKAPLAAAGIRDLLNQNRDSYYLEYPCHSPTERRWFMMHLNSFWIGDDHRIVMAHYDITERKLVEKKEHQQRVLANVLADITSTINQTFDVEEILEHIINKIRLVVPHSGANLMFVEVEQEVARIVRYCACYAEHNLPEPRLGEAISFTNWPGLKLITQQARPVAIPDTRNCPDWVVSPDTEWIRSYACAPIRLDGKVIGLINVDSDTPNAFTLEQARQLQALADQAAIAIRNALLYQELAQHNERLAQAVAERTEQLERSMEHIESILNSSSDVILRVRQNGIIQQANPTFDRWFGNQGGEAFGQPLSRLVAPHQVDQLMKTLARVFDDHQPQRIELVAQCEDGTCFDIDVALFPIQRPDGEVTSVVCSMRDITERKQNEQTLRQALEREMEVSDMRMRFLSMASHDLRNPLAVIRSGVDMLAEYHDRLSPEKKETKFRQIRVGIAHMVELLDDVLTIGQVEAGKLAFKPEHVELEVFCRNIVAEIHTSIGTDHTFDCAFTGECGNRHLDPKLLRHILYNLLSNAVKYSPDESTVTLTVDCDADRTVFCIQDEGIGIPETDRLRLFEPFYRAGNVGVAAGTGLGLTIVKQSAELHGGTVSYTTQEGAGTTFTVTLPNCQLEVDP